MINQVPYFQINIDKPNNQMDGRVNTQALTYLRHRLTTSSIQYLEKGKVAPTKCVAKGMKGKVYNYSRKYPLVI